MSNDKTTLADVQPGGRVRMGDQAERARFEQYRGGDFERDAQGYYTNPRTAQDWAMWQAALSAQPSPGGQDALDCIGRIEEAIEFRVPHDIYAAVHGELAELKAALATRQPVGEPVAWMTNHDEPMLFPTAAEAAAYCEDDEQPVPLFRSRAQDVDLPYSLDADPAGIRTRVADVITGTLMVGAQGHTPPPAGHWAEPFWRAARADAALQVKMREALWAAARSLRTIADSTKETEFLETAGEIRAYANSRANCAEQALKDSQAVGHG